MRHLILLAVLGATTLATDRPVWTWKCMNDQCHKVQMEGNSKSWSVAECRLFCDPYGSLWPRPTGHVELSRGKTVQVNVNSISVEYAGRQQMETRMRGMISEVGRIFQRQLAKTAQLDAREEECAKSLFVHLNIDDPTMTRFETDTDESYDLQVQELADGRINATISAPTFFGARHGLETLSQLVVLGADRRLRMPDFVRIQDRPVYRHRGILLDTARSYFSPDAIKRTIDGMAANKLNTFHWHVTDSQSFPFQSKTYPNLSRYGAYSPEQIYTEDDIRSIVEYARVRGVRVVPEFDEPAHVGEGWQWVGENTTVCFKAEPWQSYCVEPPCGQLNPTSDKVYQILGGIFSDMLQVFDSDIFHMGGDEVNLNCWNTSEPVTDWMDNNGLARTEEGFMDLWESFQNRAYEKLVAANGGKEMPVILWTSGLTEKGRVDKHLDKDKYIIQIWTKGEDPVVAELVQKGFKVIFSNYDALYLDCGFGAWVGEGNNWCSPYIGWQKVYGNSPVTLLINQGVQEHLARIMALGAEATLFTEQADESALDGRLWPRAAALAERLWSEPSEGWRAAEHRMLNQRERLVKRGIAADTLQPEWCRQNEGYCYL
ncbi:chitooligosaccharidolytic beta-N-acetylglucosaminidase [Anabrus simplex]|uniref:chitooligosaccharidolytic beta-N-acetylglucosaminidase n=1 Tax=Anabrus simplex TaxID=316456 RepID=UPI0035A3D011